MTAETLIKEIATHSIKTEVKLTHALGKIERITLLLVEAFDGDGIDDISFPKKINFFSIFTNIPAIVKLLRQAFIILKEPNQEIEVKDEYITPLLQQIVPAQSLTENTTEENN